MFGKRKRRPEEDSLVPHGMIWYATPEAETDKPVQEKAPETTESRQPAFQSESEVKVPPRPAVSQQLTEELRPAINSSAQLLRPATQPSAASPVAPQPRSLNSVPRAFPSPKRFSSPARVTEITAVIDLNEPQPPSKTESFSLEIQRRMAWVNSRVNATLGAAGAWASKTTLAASKNIRSSWVSVSTFVQSKKALARGSQHAHNWAQTGATSARVYSQKTRGALVVAIRGSVAGSNRIAGSCKQAFRRATTYVHHRAAGLQPRGRRVRVLFSGVPVRIRIFFARQLTRWTLRFEDAGMDARLWTSMTLAAISALIALVIVSVVPHYAAKFLPSRIPPTPSTVNASAPAAANIIASPPAGVTAQTLPESSQPPAKSAVVNSAAVKKMPTPKHHRTADDDYVAPDTFKYYGNDSKASR